MYIYRCLKQAQTSIALGGMIEDWPINQSINHQLVPVDYLPVHSTAGALHFPSL